MKWSHWQLLSSAYTMHRASTIPHKIIKIQSMWAVSWLSLCPVSLYFYAQNRPMHISFQVCFIWGKRHSGWENNKRTSRKCYLLFIMCQTWSTPVEFTEAASPHHLSCCAHLSKQALSPWGCLDQRLTSFSFFLFTTRQTEGASHQISSLVVT